MTRRTAIPREQWTAQAVDLGWDPRILGEAFPTGRKDCRRPLAALIAGCVQRAQASGFRRGGVWVVDVQLESIELVEARQVLGADGVPRPAEGATWRFYNPDTPQPWRKRVAS